MFKQKITIQKATKTQATAIAPCLFLAMGDIIYQFIGNHSPAIALKFLTEMIQSRNNQYSYENCWVLLEENKVVASALVYDGDQLQTLRQPVAEKIRQQFQLNFTPENETDGSEFYIDSIGVSTDAQGKGYGTRLLQFLIDEYVVRQQQTLGLLVDRGNPNAKKLYSRLGFVHVGNKRLMGKTMEHLQLKRSNYFS